VGCSRSGGFLRAVCLACFSLRDPAFPLQPVVHRSGHSNAVRAACAFSPAFVCPGRRLVESRSEPGLTILHSGREALGSFPAPCLKPLLHSRHEHSPLWPWWGAVSRGDDATTSVPWVGVILRAARPCSSPCAIRRSAGFSLPPRGACGCSARALVYGSPPEDLAVLGQDEGFAPDALSLEPLSGVMSGEGGLPCPGGARRGWVRNECRRLHHRRGMPHFC
jgi:hypothetical protein